MLHRYEIASSRSTTFAPEPRLMVVVMFVAPRVARRIFPALRDPEPAS
jgi:hypothetical protein